MIKKTIETLEVWKQKRVEMSGVQVVNRMDETRSIKKRKKFGNVYYTKTVT